MSSFYLRTNTQHFQWWRNINFLWQFHVTKVNGKRFAPNAKMANIEDGQIARQREHHGFLIVFDQRSLTAILVGYTNTIWCWFWATAHPEFSVCNNNEYNQSEKWAENAFVFLTLLFMNGVGIFNHKIRTQIQISSWKYELTILTWCLAVVAEIRNQNGLCIDDDNVVGCYAVYAIQCADFVWSRIFQCLWNGHIAEIHFEFVTPHGKPFDIAQCFALGQWQRHVFVTIAFDDAGAAALVA